MLENIFVKDFDYIKDKDILDNTSIRTVIGTTNLQTV